MPSQSPELSAWVRGGLNKIWATEKHVQLRLEHAQAELEWVLYGDEAEEASGTTQQSVTAIGPPEPQSITNHDHQNHGEDFTTSTTSTASKVTVNRHGVSFSPSGNSFLSSTSTEMM